MHPQLDCLEAHFAQLEHLGGPLLGRVDFAGGSVHRRAAGFLPAQQHPNRFALDLAADVPEGGFHPVVAPAQIADFAQALTDGGDVGWVEADEVWADQTAQALALALKGHASRQALHTVVGRQAQQGEAVLGLGIAGDPRGVERLGQRDGDMKQFDAVNFHRSFSFALIICTSPTQRLLTLWAQNNGLNAKVGDE